jgi:hypothetical protein
MALERKVSRIQIDKTNGLWLGSDLETRCLIDENGYFKSKLKKDINGIKSYDVEFVIKWIECHAYVKKPSFGLKGKYYNLDLLKKIIVHETENSVSIGAIILAFFTLGYEVKRNGPEGAVNLHRPLGDYLEDTFRLAKHNR